MSPRWERKSPIRSQKSPWLPLKPKSFGSCVLARCRATPVLNPVITVSEMKLTSAACPERARREAEGGDEECGRRGERGVARGVAAGHSASDAPTSSEIADVTVTAVCCELQKSQNTSPANRHA